LGEGRKSAVAGGGSQQCGAIETAEVELARDDLRLVDLRARPVRSNARATSQFFDAATRESELASSG
jgi:hypothetical protein